MWETQVLSLCWEDPLEKEVATHSSILAWEISWTKESSGLQTRDCKELDTGGHAHSSMDNKRWELAEDWWSTTKVCTHGKRRKFLFDDVCLYNYRWGWLSAEVRVVQNLSGTGKIQNHCWGDMLLFLTFITPFRISHWWDFHNRFGNRSYESFIWGNMTLEKYSPVRYIFRDRDLM